MNSCISNRARSNLYLRPHHILCIRAYRGKGYSQEFIENMNSVIARLKAKEPFTVTFGTDSICETCPHNVSGCLQTEKVQDFDSKVTDLLDLREKQTYSYDVLEKLVQERLTEEAYTCICSTCEWQKNNVCNYQAVYRGCL
ncbi:MAG: DUF1284 domain-containing protein [Termitinemataceae bacterium]